MFSVLGVSGATNRSKRVVVLVAVGAAMVALGAGPAVAQSVTRVSTATAELRTGEGEPVGTAEFVETSEGVEVTANITGNVPPGEHGLHIHETGDLSDPAFESAGDHFNPTEAEHGFDNPNGPHAGDLRNITISEDGTANYSYLNDRITLSGGPNSILDSDGSAIVIHDMRDDYTTDDDPQTGPGMSGDRIAAGAIEESETVPNTGGVNLLAIGAGVVLVVVGAVVFLVRRLRG